ncbi:hypothetical protein ACFRQM_00095 [Streptomyces sp. NPDC056831]|uniref:hypothetical protein n=1 Tax=Streptomyces sp. NPDC056831 TaxID=3345954 RepID=UPI0036AEB0A0
MNPPPDRLDGLDRLIEEFRALPATSDRKREIVAELDDAPDALPFLIAVVADPREYDLARIEAATILRLWPPSDPACRRTRVSATESGSCPRSRSRLSSRHPCRAGLHQGPARTRLQHHLPPTARRSF